MLDIISLTEQGEEITISGHRESVKVIMNEDDNLEIVYCDENGAEIKRIVPCVDWVE